MGGAPYERIERRLDGLGRLVKGLTQVLRVGQRVAHAVLVGHVDLHRALEAVLAVGALPTRRCFLPALRRISLPEPLTENRLADERWVFILGMGTYFSFLGARMIKSVRPS